MSDETNETQLPRRAIGWVSALFLLLLLMMAATALWPGSDSRLIKPFVPTETAVPVTYDAPFEPVSFPDLQANPELYRDQHIRVTGRYTRLTPPNCVSFDGPVIRWGLIADDLQMNAQGLESLLHLIPADTTLTVEGVWRHYRGPSGCGKEPETASVWYLVVSRIVQPNPLPLPGLPPINGGAVPTMTATAVSGAQLTPTPTVNETAVTPTLPGATPTQVFTITPPGVPTITPTDTTLTPNATALPTASPTSVFDIPATATATATATPTLAGATPDSNATATPTNNSQTPVGVPTATPEAVETSSYPAPPTSTPFSGYP